MPNLSCCSVAFTDFTQTPLSALLMHPRLPSALIEESARLPLSRRHQFLACRALLAEMLFHRLTIEYLPCITTEYHARPQFIDTQLPDFNISHSGNFIGVAVNTTEKIGLDIEFLRPCQALLSIAEKHFSMQELIWLKAFDENERQIAFWRLWTLRESILKLHSKGVWQMKQITIDPIAMQGSAIFSTTLYHYQHVTPTLCWSVSADRPILAIAITMVEKINNCAMFDAPIKLT